MITTISAATVAVSRRSCDDKLARIEAALRDTRVEEGHLRERLGELLGGPTASGKIARGKGERSVGKTSDAHRIRAARVCALEWAREHTSASNRSVDEEGERKERGNERITHLLQNEEAPKRRAHHHKACRERAVTRKAETRCGASAHSSRRGGSLPGIGFYTDRKQRTTVNCQARLSV